MSVEKKTAPGNGKKIPWYRRLTQRGEEEYAKQKRVEEWRKAEELLRKQKPELLSHEAIAKVEEPPSLHEWFIENTDIDDPAHPKMPKTEPISWIMRLYLLILLAGVEAALFINMWGMLTYGLVPLEVNASIFGAMVVACFSLTVFFLSRRRSRGRAIRDTDQIMFQTTTLIGKDYYRGSIRGLDREYPTPDFNARDIEELWFRSMRGLHLPADKVMIDEINATYKWILDPKVPLTSWLKPYREGGYYYDSQGKAIEKLIEFWPKGIGLGHTFSRWIPVDISTGYGWEKGHTIMFDLYDMSWRKRKIQDEETGEPIVAWHPVFMIGNMPHGLREHLHGAATEKILKTCEEMPTTDHMQQTITSQNVAIARLIKRGDESDLLHDGTHLIPEVMDRVSNMPAAPSPQPSGQPQNVTPTVPQTHNSINWLLLGFIVSTFLLGVFIFLSLGIHAI